MIGGKGAFLSFNSYTSLTRVTLVLPHHPPYALHFQRLCYRIREIIQGIPSSSTKKWQMKVAFLSGQLPGATPNGRSIPLLWKLARLLIFPSPSSDNSGKPRLSVRHLYKSPFYFPPTSSIPPPQLLSFVLGSKGDILPALFYFFPTSPLLVAKARAEIYFPALGFP